MKLWVFLAVALSAVSAYPFGRDQSLQLYPTTTTTPPPTGLGTETKAQVSGRAESVGNARIELAGGSKTREVQQSQQSGANARVKIEAQQAAIGKANAVAKGRSDVTGQASSEQASSDTKAAARGVSVGQARTQSDANGAAATRGHGTKTDGNSGISTATEGDGASSGLSKAISTASRQTVDGVSEARSDTLSGTIGQSQGAAGVTGAGRGRSAAVEGNTTTVSGSQTKVDVIGDGKARAQEAGGAVGQSGSSATQQHSGTEAANKGQVETRGPGAGATGESSSKATASKGETTTGSTANNKITAARDGQAKTSVYTRSASLLGLDRFSGDLVGGSKSSTFGNQSSLGNANSALNAASLAQNALGGGAAVSDSSYRAQTAGDGAVSGALETRGQTRLKAEGRPVQLSLVELIRQQQQQRKEALRGKGPVLPHAGKGKGKGRRPTQRLQPPTPPPLPRGKKQ